MDAVALPVFRHGAEEQGFSGEVVLHIHADAVPAVLVNIHGQVFCNGIHEQMDFRRIVFPVAVFHSHFDGSAVRGEVAGGIIPHPRPAGADLKSVIGRGKRIEIEPHFASRGLQRSLRIAFGELGLDRLLTQSVVHGENAGFCDFLRSRNGGKFDHGRGGQQSGQQFGIVHAVLLFHIVIIGIVCRWGNTFRYGGSLFPNGSGFLFHETFFTGGHRDRFLILLRSQKLPSPILERPLKLPRIS